MPNRRPGLKRPTLHPKTDEISTFMEHTSVALRRSDGHQNKRHYPDYRAPNAIRVKACPYRQCWLLLMYKAATAFSIEHL